MCPRFPAQLPLPLLTLTVGSSTFLDTVLTNAGTPAFALETTGNKTVLSRCDPRLGLSELPACIEWPTTDAVKGAKEPAATISINGRTESTSSFWKKSVMGSNSRKFHMPGCSGSLKWKRVGDHFEATLCSLACSQHTAVALFEPQSGRLSFFMTAVDKAQPTQLYSGISLQLIEYMVLSLVLLTTRWDEWRLIPNTSFGFVQPSPSSEPSTLNGQYPQYFTQTPIKSTFATQVLHSYQQKTDLLAPQSPYLIPTLYLPSPSHSPPASPPTPYADIHMDTQNSLLYPSSRPTTPQYMDLSRRGSAHRQYHNHNTLPPAPLQPPPLPPSQRPSPLLQITPLPQPDEMPPSYSEIEWTVRIPRRRHNAF